MARLVVCILVLTLFGFYASAQESHQCDFENGICSFLKNARSIIIQEGKSWILGSGRQNAGDTGPSFDHTLGNENGKYLFVNLTESRLNFVLLETVPLNDSYCLRFFYHMYGAEVPTFKVYAESLSDGTSQTYFVRMKTQGDRWKEAEISIIPTHSMNRTGYKVSFKRTLGKGKDGFIALDDIRIRKGVKCGLAPPEADPLYEDECDPKKCLHGTCELIEKNYKCKCDEGFIGKNCDNRKFEIPGYTYLWIVYVALFSVSVLLLIAAGCLYCKSKRNTEKSSSVIYPPETWHPLKWMF